MSLTLRQGTLAIFSGFSRLLDAFRLLTEAVQSLANAQRSAAPAIERLDALELSRHKFEAEVNGVLLEAKGKLKAAANAEARERHQRETYEANFNPVPEAGDEGSGESPILPDHVEASETERVSALRLDLAPGTKAAALNAKWAR